MIIASAVLVALVIGFEIGRWFENRIMATALNMIFKNKEEKNIIMKEVKKRVKRINRETKSK